MSRFPTAAVRRSHKEDGWVVITAIILMTIMLGVGLAVLATADTQSQQSRRERVRESAFNLAEGLMGAESVVLQSNWPNSPPCATNDIGCGYGAPTACTQLAAASPTTQCPTPSNVVGNAGTFSNVDQSLSSTSYSIQIRDDQGVCLANPPNTYQAFYSNCQIPTYYAGLCPPPFQTDATKCWPATAPHTYSTNPNEAPGVDQKLCKDSNNVSVVCTWDANGNNQVWVRVDATVNGRTRSMVALLHLEDFPVTLNSKDAVNGGAVSFSNNGNKDIVDATGSQIVTRCVPTTGADPTTGDPLKSTIADVVPTATTPVFTVTMPNTAANAGFNTLGSGAVVALGTDTGTTPNVPPYELLEIQSRTIVGPNIQFVFKSKVLYAHTAAAGTNKIELAPTPGNASPVNNCETWQAPNAPSQNGADKHQLDAPQNYHSDPNYPNFLDDTTFAGVIAGLKVWTSCPTNWNGSIYIASLPAGTTCSIPNGTFNSAAKPHFIIVNGNIAQGCSAPALSLSGNTVYYGVLYMRNKQGCGFAQSILNIAAGAQVQGGVAIDGNAKVNIGNASNTGNCAVVGGTSPNTYCPTIKFDPVAFGSVSATGAAGLVQNTWRELAPGQ